MTMDREKEREIELESAMYTNCLLLGLDPAVIGVGASNGTPRVGLFRHSNPKLGEQLLYFILSSLRGPAQSAKDFDKARIALERRRFLKNAETAVQRQAMWSNLAHEMTAEFRGLCAEEAYLQQELEKLHDLRNKVKLEGELWDDLVSSSSQNSHLVSKATRLWESILARKSQHEVLASGPIEDLIAHREHRYRISGSSLRAAMDQSSQVPYTDVLASQSSDLDSVFVDDKDQSDKSYASSQVSDDSVSWMDDRSGRVHPTVDVAEIIRRWTHALQRIHKQSLHLAKANDGEGPEILRGAHDGGTSGHAESLSATLAEHQQHLASLQVLINQLKEVAPGIQKSITECTEKVNNISLSLPPVTKHPVRSMSSPMQAQTSGRTSVSSTDEVSEVTSKMSSVQLDKVSASPTLKLPQLFSLTPNSSGKMGNTQRRHTMASQTSQVENSSENKSHDQPSSNDHINSLSQDTETSYVQNLKRSVREAALSMKYSNPEPPQEGPSDGSAEHFFVPLSGTGFSRLGPDSKGASTRSRRLSVPQIDVCVPESPAFDFNNGINFNEFTDALNDLDSLNDFDELNGFLSSSRSNTATSDGRKLVFDLDEAQDQVFSPPLLMDSSLLADSYEDLLAPLSETETAMMEH